VTQPRDGAIIVELPSMLQPYAAGRAEIRLGAPCRTVGDALAAVATLHGGVTDRVMDERGVVRQHVNVFVDGENIRFTAGLETPVDPGSTIVIVPAVSGG
jgi:molybdopterin converting factor small subunit